MRYLTAAMVAPLAAHGATTQGGTRSSWDRPARSAILGLVGACLGVGREDAAGQEALRSYGTAVLTVSAGTPLEDFHTVHTPVGRGPWRTRRDELSGEPYTVVTRRSYRQDGWWLLALWPRDMAPRWTLETVAAAMEAPVWAPAAGRRSCPLALPLAPRVIEAPDPIEALLSRHRDGPEAPWRERWGVRPRHLLAHLDAADAPPGRAARTVARRDEPLAGRLFALRDEVVVEIAAPPAPSATLDLETVL